MYDEYSDYDPDWHDDADYDDGDLELGNDKCPYCGSLNTIRIDTISADPMIWYCECHQCGEGFELLTNQTEDTE